MRKMFASMLVVIGLVGTTVLAQQEEPPPAIDTKPASEPKPAESASTSALPSGALSDATIQPIDQTPLLSTNAPANPARPDLAIPNSSSGSASSRPLNSYRTSPGLTPGYSQNTRQALPARGESPRYPSTQPAQVNGLLPPGYGPSGYASGPSYPTQNPPIYSNSQMTNMVPTSYGPALYASGGYNPKDLEAQRKEFEKASEFGRTIDALRLAKTEDERTELRDKLSAMVSEQLDNDLAEREKRLAEIEVRAKELREQLQQRKQSKAEIQKLVMMLIENPQGGLGLPSSFMNVINQPNPFQPGQPYSTSFSR